jgi:hypothetical protein
VNRVAVVDDEADRERRPVRAHLAAQVRGLDRECPAPRAGGPRGRRAQRGVDRDVQVAAPRQPVACVLAGPHAHERAGAAADPAALDRARVLDRLERPGDVGLDVRDGRDTFEAVDGGV